MLELGRPVHLIRRCFYEIGVRIESFGYRCDAARCHLGLLQPPNLEPSGHGKRAEWSSRNSCHDHVPMDADAVFQSGRRVIQQGKKSRKKKKLLGWREILLSDAGKNQEGSATKNRPNEVEPIKGAHVNPAIVYWIARHPRIQNDGEEFGC